MKFSSHYLHVTGGRLRIKIPQVKNSHDVGQKIELRLANLRGVTKVQANRLTGNVLVLFNSKCIRHEDIVEVIRKQGYLKEPKAPQRASRVDSANRSFRQNYASNIVADIILQKALELTLRRALLAIL